MNRYLDSDEFEAHDDIDKHSRASDVFLVFLHKSFPHRLESRQCQHTYYFGVQGSDDHSVCLRARGSGSGILVLEMLECQVFNELHLVFFDRMD